MATTWLNFWLLNFRRVTESRRASDLGYIEVRNCAGREKSRSEMGKGLLERSPLGANNRGCFSRPLGLGQRSSSAGVSSVLDSLIVTGYNKRSY